MLGELDDLKDELERLGDRLERSAKSNSNITINGGGIGVWIATVCCAVMLGMGVIGGYMLINQDRKIGELNAYLSAIYAQAPHLKPEDE